MGAFQGKPVAKCEEGNQNLSALADLMGTPPAAADATSRLKKRSRRERSGMIMAPTIPAA